MLKYSRLTYEPASDTNFLYSIEQRILNVYRIARLKYERLRYEPAYNTSNDSPFIAKNPLTNHITSMSMEVLASCKKSTSR